MSNDFKTPTDPALRSPSVVIESLRLQMQSIQTQSGAELEKQGKLIALLESRLETVEARNESLSQQNDRARTEIRELRVELRDFKAGRSRVSG